MPGKPPSIGIAAASIHFHRAVGRQVDDVRMPLIVPPIFSSIHESESNHEHSLKAGSHGFSSRGWLRGKTCREGSGYAFPEKEPGRFVTQKFYTLRNLWYTRHNGSQHLDIEGGWSSDGNEEGSSEEAREESGEEEEVGTIEEATATSPPHLLTSPHAGLARRSISKLR
jgi:hypothetical protein